MLKILAKLNTDEKIAVLCHPAQVHFLQGYFNKKYGGDWLQVETVTGTPEILKFNDGQIYKGFEPGKPDDYRYCAAIETIVKD